MRPWGSGSARPLSSWWRAGRRPGVMAGEPVSTPLLRFPSVSRKGASATPVPSEHSSYFGSGGKNPPRAAQCLCCHWDVLSLGLQKWGEPGLAPPLRLLRLSDTLLGKTRGIREGSERNRSVSRLKGVRPRLGLPNGWPGMLAIGSQAAFCVKRQPPRLCRASGWMQSWDTTGGEVTVFIHCSLSRAQGVPLVFILC